VESMYPCISSMVHGGVRVASNGYNPLKSPKQWNYKLGMVEIPGRLGQ